MTWQICGLCYVMEGMGEMKKLNFVSTLYSTSIRRHEQALERVFRAQRCINIGFIVKFNLLLGTPRVSMEFPAVPKENITQESALTII